MTKSVYIGRLFMLGVLACVAVLTGCANLSPVKKFANETKSLTAAFDPMLAGSMNSCIDKYKQKKMFTSRHFDPEEAQKYAARLCGPIDEDNKVIADLNSLLEQYADTLLALADDSVPSYKAELDGLAASLGKVKKPGAQDPLISSDKIGAVSGLTEFLSRAATQRMQRNAIRDLLTHEAAILTITNALKDYANLNYRAWLRDERRENEILKKSLDASTQSEPLASNYLKTVLLKDDQQIAEREKTIDSFVKSVEQFQKTNSEIRQKLDKLDNKELLSQLAAYTKEVAKVHKQMQAAFDK